MSIEIRKSLVLVTVDCLRADHVGFMGYDRPITPFLDSLAEEAFVIPEAVVAGAPTYYSFPAIMGSQYPLAMGRDLLGLAPGEPSLASVLRDAGYTTAAFGAANPYISRRFGYDHGFDTFQDFLDSDLSPFANEAPKIPENGRWIGKLNRKLDQFTHKLGPVGSIYDELYFQYCQRLAMPRDMCMDMLRRFPSAEVIVDQACSWLMSISESPFFLWLHLMDPHSPYYPTEKALESLGQGNVTPFRARYLNSYWNRTDLSSRRLARHRQAVIDLYDAGVHWVDTQMARLVEALRQIGRWDSCIFAFTADHGEEFLDHGGRYHPPLRLMEELIHVPLILRVPGSLPRKLPKSPFSSLHLAPTLLEAAQLPVPPEFRGRSLWRQVQEEAPWDEVAIAECVAGCTNPFQPQNRMGARVLVVRESRYKLMLHFDTHSEHLYDLEADPDERAPLPKEAEPKVRRRLLQHALVHLEAFKSQRVAKLRLKTRLRELRLECTERVHRSQPFVT